MYGIESGVKQKKVSKSIFALLITLVMADLLLLAVPQEEPVKAFGQGAHIAPVTVADAIEWLAEAQKSHQWLVDHPKEAQAWYDFARSQNRITATTELDQQWVDRYEAIIELLKSHK